MKVLWFLIAVISCTSVKARYAQSTIQQFREVLEKTTRLNANKRTENEEGSLARCPLAKYHENFLDKRDNSGSSASNVVQALKVLRENGIPDSELRSEEMLEEIKKQTTDICQYDFEDCDPFAIYRTPDGLCNNLVFPNWGRAGVEQYRLLAPEYDWDDFYSIRNTSAYSANPLPNPRLISNAVHSADGAAIRSKISTLHVFQFGQFLDHDITLTPVDTSVSDCCANADDTFYCCPIFVQEDETPWTFFNQGYCMNVQRSRPSDCDFFERQQVSALTSFIDASNVYGSSMEEQLAIRDNINGVPQGYLRIEYDRLPPKDDDLGCTIDGFPEPCLQCGDERCAVVPSLASYHQVFAMEHNRIAACLEPYYTNQEELFEETRRILIAIMQHIAYDEFLPSILSEDTMSYYYLRNSEIYYYDPYWNPTMSNEFGMGYRIGHTWVSRAMVVTDSDFVPLEFRLTENTFNDLFLYLGNFGSVSGPGGLALWLTEELNAETDEKVEDSVRSFLFQNITTQTAFDLVSLNIKRGRDHGIPGYTKYVEWCYPYIVISSWFDLTFWELMTQELVDKLQQVYSGPDDIDPFVGFLAESFEGNLGPTVNCILGDQFYSAKYGDRFFYQNTDINTNPYPFTNEQIDAIHDYSLAKLLCNNYPFVEIDSNAFVTQEIKTPCSSLTDLDIYAFLPGNKRNQKDGDQGIDRGVAGADKREGDADGGNTGNDGSAAGKRPSESAGKRWQRARGLNHAGERDEVIGKLGSGTGAGPNHGGFARSGRTGPGKRGRVADPSQRDMSRSGITGAGKRGRVADPSQRDISRSGITGAGKRGSVAGSRQPGVARSDGGGPNQPDDGARGDDTSHNATTDKKEADALKMAIEDLLEKLKEE